MPKTLPKAGYHLTDSPFYRLISRRKLASVLRVSPTMLANLSSEKLFYQRVWKHKKEKKWLREAPSSANLSDYRPIDIPAPELKGVLTRIAQLLGRVQPPDFLFSPVKGRSYVDNAAYHVGSSAFWLLDIENYFPTCTTNHLARFFHRDMCCSQDVAAVLVKLVSLNGCLPQGSPCSPILAYYCNRPMWLALADRALSAGCKFSVYADDITISGDIVRKKMIWDLKQIVHGHGMALKKSKEVSLIYKPADITGVIVKVDGTYIPNRQLEKLAKLKKQRISVHSQKDKAKLENQIAGRVAQRRQVERSMAN